MRQAKDEDTTEKRLLPSLVAKKAERSVSFWTFSQRQWEKDFMKDSEEKFYYWDFEDRVHSSPCLETREECTRCGDEFSKSTCKERKV